MNERSGLGVAGGTTDSWLSIPIDEKVAPNNLRKSCLLQDWMQNYAVWLPKKMGVRALSSLVR